MATPRNRHDTAQFTKTTAGCRWRSSAPTAALPRFTSPTAQLPARPRLEGPSYHQQCHSFLTPFLPPITIASVACDP